MDQALCLGRQTEQNLGPYFREFLGKGGPRGIIFVIPGKTGLFFGKTGNFEVLRYEGQGLRRVHPSEAAAD